jgi:hypothetical protein
VADKQNQRTLLWHGNTVHGIQSTNPDYRYLPPAYYHPTGPVGDIFLQFGARFSDIAVVGLGAGALSSYAAAGTHFDYYEIDPAVVGIATNSRFFSFIEDATARKSRQAFSIGDARLTLAEAADARYDLIILDAFSGGSIPTHLLTKESLSLYISKLNPKGLILFHISNNFLDLSRLLCSLALSEDLLCFAKSSGVTDEVQRAQNKLPSQWLVMTRNAENAGVIKSLGWAKFDGPPIAKIWTDNYSSILDVLR